MNVLIVFLLKSRAPSSLVRKCWTQYVRHASSGSATDFEYKSPTGITIQIPNRIHRGPTDILKALEGTVRIDYTGPQYRFRDDPYLTTPHSNSSVRGLFVSYESGRDAARYIRDENSILFQQVIADPPIKSLLPRKPLLEETPVDEALLLDKIQNSLVSDAKKVYERMVAKGMDISHQTRQALLELLCYFNSEDPPPKDDHAFRFHASPKTNSRQNTWKNDPLVKSLFDSLKTPAAYSALICGMYRKAAIEEANEIFEEARQKNITLDVKVYNKQIENLFTMYDVALRKREKCLEILKEMNSLGVQPDVETSFLAIVVLTFFNPDRNFGIAQKAFREFREIGIKPSLGTYSEVVRHLMPRLETNDLKRLVQVIIKEVKGKELKIEHPHDLFFFPLMVEACYYAQDVQGAIDILTTAHDYKNHLLLGDHVCRLKFYNLFLHNIILNASVEVAVQWCKNLVPHFTRLSAESTEALFDAFETFGTLEHVAPFWRNFLESRVYEQKTLMKIMGVAVSLSSLPIPLAQEVKPQLAKLAQEVWEEVDAEDSRLDYNARFSCTDEVLNHLLILFAQAHQWASVQKVMEKMDEMYLPPADKTLDKVITICIEEQYDVMATWVVKFALQKFKLGAPQAKRLCTSSLLSEESKEEVRQILTAQGLDSDSDTSSSSSSGESDGDSSDSDDDLSIPKKGKQGTALPKPGQKL